MIKNYLTVTWRNMKRNKIYSFINITGLAIGLAAFMLIGMYVRFELSFDQFHEKADRICRVEQILEVNGRKDATAACPAPLASVLLKDFPQIERVSRGCGQFPFQISITNTSKIQVEHALIVDHGFLHLFSFPLLKGDVQTALTEPRSAVITADLAQRLFGMLDPLGQVIRAENPQIVQGDNPLELKITGVMANVPPNSHLNFELLISEATLIPLFGNDVFNYWSDNWAWFYILAKPGQSIPELNQKIRFASQNYHPSQQKNEFYLRPLTQIHLHANVNWEFGEIGSMKNCYIFSAIALFILVIAGINFINLTTARSADRAREVGLRKVSGAQRTALIRQFLGESMLAALIAMALSLLLISMLSPEFRNIVNPNLHFRLFENGNFLLGAVALALVVGILAGLYPAIYLSAFHPIKVLKGKLASGSGNSGLRKTLVFCQFCISIALIISTIIISQQIYFLLHKNKGYNTDQVMIIPLNTQKAGQMAVFRDELRQNRQILNVGNSDYLLHSANNWTRVSWEGAPPNEFIKMNVNYVDENLIPTYGMTIVQGRDFSKEFVADKGKVAIINETAATQLGWEDPIGKQIFYDLDYRLNNIEKVTVVGVVKDFNFQSLHHKITPFMLRLFPPEISGWNISVKISHQDIPRTLAFIEAKFKTFFPDENFNYHFMDEDFQRIYAEERKTGKIVRYLGLLSIFIACLGLYGLTSYSLKQRIKEIGIRKVLGATVRSIVITFSIEYIKWIALANVIIWPITWYLLHQWLQNFAYRIELTLWPFIAAGVIALGIAFLTIAGQAVRAALANPMESLRYE
ncbi:ABC transporter permease [candidate division KSB1 bacterium]|nr:ABC transporter permease [candidate division KSB1 bacterium]